MDSGGVNLRLGIHQVDDFRVAPAKPEVFQAAADLGLRDLVWVKVSPFMARSTSLVRAVSRSMVPALSSAAMA